MTEDQAIVWLETGADALNRVKKARLENERLERENKRLTTENDKMVASITQQGEVEAKARASVFEEATQEAARITRENAIADATEYFRRAKTDADAYAAKMEQVVKAREQKLAQIDETCKARATQLLHLEHALEERRHEAAKHAKTFADMAKDD